MPDKINIELIKSKRSPHSCYHFKSFGIIGNDQNREVQVPRNVFRNNHMQMIEEH